MSNYRYLWAKSDPRHPLWKHMLDAAAVSLAIPPRIKESGWGSRETAFVVGLHDVGKADSSFQHQEWKNADGEACSFTDELITAGFEKTQDARCRHERISAKFIKQRLVRDNMDRFTADAVSRTIVAHHGYWNEGAPDRDRVYARAQADLCRMLEEVLAVEALPCDSPTDLSSFGMRLAGHVVLCDWIASNEKFISDRRLADEGEPERYLKAAMAVASEWVRSLGLTPDTHCSRPLLVVDTPRPIQQALLDTDIPPGLVIIEAPMGEGKTEAAWILAEKWREQGCHGMYMALPTMSTSDSLYARYNEDYLKKLGCEKDAKLVHGMAWLRDEAEQDKSPEVGEPGDDQSLAAAWFRPTRRAMLAAHGVGTVDQAMLAGMNVKLGFLRLFGLADRVLVIDEVHAYDAYMSAIIVRLLNWCACLKIPVVLLSATLSAGQRAVMIKAYGATGGDPRPDAPYPLITVAEPGKEVWTIPKRDGPEIGVSSSRTLKMQTHPGLLGDAMETAKKAEELVKDGGCCCVILNTVKQAQAVFSALKFPEAEKLLFHARFMAGDRKKIADRVLDLFGKDTSNRPEKFVLVATQVVEQSLDVDFDHMITEIAPIDLLLQRSGRMHRHKERDHDPILHVLVSEGTKDKKTHSGKKVNGPDFGASEKIYERYPLLTTLGQLKPTADDDGIDVQLPSQFRPLIKATYTDTLPTNASEDLKEAKQEWDDLQEDLAAQAGEFLLCEPMADEFDPVGADEVGDDSDDGNGWRARTRLGLADVLVIPLSAKQVEKYKAGKLHPRLVKWLYRRSVKIPPYYWPPESAKGYDKPVLGQKRLRGVWLLPVKKDDAGWKWEGIKEDGKPYGIQYDSITGLTHGGEK